MTGKRKALYEPVHGSAPDIAGQGIANPIAMIASLRHGAALFVRPRSSSPARVETAISAVLDKGLRTADIAARGEATVSTSAMGDAIVAELRSR